MKAIGLDVGRSTIKAGIVDSDGVVLRRLTEETVKSGKGDEVINQIISIAGKLFEGSSEEISGVGIGFAGRVDADAGKILHGTNFLEMENVDICKLVSKKIPLPVLLENDVKVKAMAEKEFGAAQPFSDFIYMALGTGIGGAIFVNGILYGGRDGLAGEVGHIIVEKNGVACGCGKKGHFEALVRMVREDKLPWANAHGIRRLPSSTSLFSAASSTDLHPWYSRPENKRDRETMSRVADIIANVVANLVHVLNPEAVIIGGGVAKAGEYLFKPLKERLSELVLPDFYRNLSVLVGELGDDSGIVGSGILVFRHRKENYVV